MGYGDDFCGSPKQPHLRKDGTTGCQIKAMFFARVGELGQHEDVRMLGNPRRLESLSVHKAFANATTRLPTTGRFLSTETQPEKHRP